jgi:hypothetical protein
MCNVTIAAAAAAAVARLSQHNEGFFFKFFLSSFGKKSSVLLSLSFLSISADVCQKFSNHNPLHNSTSNSFDLLPIWDASMTLASRYDHTSLNSDSFFHL